MGGRFSCVKTPITPATREASLVSIWTMRPLAIAESTTAP